MSNDPVVIVETGGAPVTVVNPPPAPIVIGPTEPGGPVLLIAPPAPPVNLLVDAPAPPTVFVQPAGPPGPQGEPGVQGPQGDPGTGATALSVTFRQDVPAAVWLIEHGLNAYPTLAIYDSTNAEVWGDVQYLDANTLTVTFASAFSGVARLI